MARFCRRRNDELGRHGVDQIQWALGMDATGPVELTPLSEGSNGQVKMKYANGVPVNFVIEPGKGPMGGAIFICEKGKLEVNRNKFTSNPPEIAQQLLKNLDIEEEDANGATIWRSGRPNGTCRIGSTAFARANYPWPTSRSDIGRSRFAIWQILPEQSAKHFIGIPRKRSLTTHRRINSFPAMPSRVRIAKDWLVEQSGWVLLLLISN